MLDANSSYQTVVLISLGMRNALDSSGDGSRQPQLEETLAFFEAMLQDSGASRWVRASNKSVMGLFSGADVAFGVACSVQQACRERYHDSMPEDVRILLDTQEGNPGLVSPVSAGGVGEGVEHLLEQVPPGQIFATRAITEHLSDCAHVLFTLSEQEVAGHSTDNRLFQVICNEETVTRIAIPTQYQERSGGKYHLNLRWRDNIMTVTPESPTLTIGRGDQSDIQIESELASRLHARLGFLETNFILADQSTNGTYVQIDEDDQVFLHQEQIVLRGRGAISLGRQIRAGGGKVIYFKLIRQS